MHTSWAIMAVLFLPTVYLTARVVFYAFFREKYRYHLLIIHAMKETEVGQSFASKG